MFPPERENQIQYASSPSGGLSTPYSQSTNKFPPAIIAISYTQGLTVTELRLRLTQISKFAPYFKRNSENRAVRRDHKMKNAHEISGLDRKYDYRY